MSTFDSKAPGSCAGFSLLEVLVAGTIFSFGLAGLSALLLTSMIGSAEARHEGIASVAAANLAEQIRLNPAELDRYLNPPTQVSGICLGGDPCTPAQQADYDFRLWQIELADRIQHARGVVCFDTTPTDGEVGNDHCDGAGPLVIKIFWHGRAKPASEESSQYRLVLEVS